MRITMRLMLTAALVASVAAIAFAQGPKPGGPGAPPGGAQVVQFRGDQIPWFQLMRMTHQIQRIDSDKKLALTPAQAKKALAILKPLRSKPKLTADQAKHAAKDLKAIFTPAQLSAMAKMQTQPHFGGRSGGHGAPGALVKPGGPIKPSGRGGPGGFRMMTPSAMKDFNPFYARVGKSDPFAAARARRWDDFFKTLEARSKGDKNARFAPPRPRRPMPPAKPKK